MLPVDLTESHCFPDAERADMDMMFETSFVLCSLYHREREREREREGSLI